MVGDGPSSCFVSCICYVVGVVLLFLFCCWCYFVYGVVLLVVLLFAVVGYYLLVSWFVGVLSALFCCC